MSARTRYAFNDPPLQEQAMNMTSPTKHSGERAALTPPPTRTPPTSKRWSMHCSILTWSSATRLIPISSRGANWPIGKDPRLR